VQFIPGTELTAEMLNEAFGETLSSDVIIEYLGSGLAADRPAVPSVPVNALALYLSTDTGDLAAWYVDHWATIINFNDDTPIPPTPTPTVTNGFLLEDGSGLFLLEDGSGFLVQEGP